MNLGHVVQHSHKLPLPVDLFLPAQAESFDPDSIVDMAENGFNDAQSHAVNMATKSPSIRCES